MQEAVLDLEMKLAKIQFPNKIREGNGTYDDFNRPYDLVIDYAERFDGVFRDRALQWRKEGKENATENLVGFYDGFVKVVGALDKDPEAGVELWRRWGGL
ncbi:MAG: hypothetical protein M1812_006919 [Candelaria pacifica]|nr:MAG: hypothetical protein M1812_006919 [Candelaria pacifica]